MGIVLVEVGAPPIGLSGLTDDHILSSGSAEDQVIPVLHYLKAIIIGFLKATPPQMPPRPGFTVALSEERIITSEPCSGAVVQIGISLDVAGQKHVQSVDFGLE